MSVSRSALLEGMRSEIWKQRVGVVANQAVSMNNELNIRTDIDLVYLSMY